jgi:hypothetical protein
MLLRLILRKKPNKGVSMSNLSKEYKITEQGDNVIIPKALWEDMKELAEHIYIYGLVEKRKDSETKYGLNELLEEEGLSYEDLES